MPQSGACKLRSLKRGLHSIGHEVRCRRPLQFSGLAMPANQDFELQFIDVRPRIYRVFEWRTPFVCLTLLSEPFIVLFYEE